MELLALFLKGLPDDRLVRLGQSDSGKLQLIVPGNSRLDLYCQVQEDQRHDVDVRGRVSAEEFTGPTPTAIVNCISDPETMGGSLAGAADIVAICQKDNPTIIVVNHPDSVQRVRRDAIYQQFHHLPGIVIPRTVRVKPRRADDVLGLLDRFGMKFPFLIRPTRMDDRRVLVRINGLQDRDLLEQFAYDGREFFLTNYRDTKGVSGLYRKLRIVVIRGELYPQHLIISDDWKIGANSRTRLMKSRVDLCESEKEFLEGFDELLSPQTRESIGKIYQLLALDIFVVDCAPATDGRMFIFDIHTSLHATPAGEDAENPHVEPFFERIRTACKELVHNPTLPTDDFWAGFTNQ